MFCLFTQISLSLGMNSPENTGWMSILGANSLGSGSHFEKVYPEKLSNVDEQVAAFLKRVKEEIQIDYSLYVSANGLTRLIIQTKSMIQTCLRKIFESLPLFRRW